MLRYPLTHLCHILAFFSSVADADGSAAHERRQRIPGWQRADSTVEKDNALTIHIFLAQQNLEEAHDHLVRISDPTRPEYGRHWTAKQVADWFAPPPDSVKEVTKWLAESGIPRERLHRSGDNSEMYFDTTIDGIERLLNTTYYAYEHERNYRMYGWDEYRVPQRVHKYIDFISPTVQWWGQEEPTNLARRQQMSPRDTTDMSSDCTKLTTPACLRQAYGIPERRSWQPNNSLGTVTFYSGAYVQEDMNIFFAQFQPELVGHEPKFESIDGGINDDTYRSFGHNGEANLDLSYTMALASPMDITNYHVGDPFRGGFINHLLAAFDDGYCDALDPNFDATYGQDLPTRGENSESYGHPSLDCGSHEPAKVISISYGGTEGQFTPAYEKRQCNEFLKLGLMGVTVVLGSGDYGVRSKQITEECDDSNEKFHVGFPASCPYVLSVGGTQLEADAEPGAHEVAFEWSPPNNESNAAILSSGGGFSDVFSRPAYQTEAIESYLAAEDSNLSKFDFNRTGRGYPDISANANAYAMVVNGTFTTIYGTSASAPTVASIIAMINDERLVLGKSTVGFINPILYANSQIFDDVTEGSNYNCRRPAFNAIQGWDPVTGLGTPNYERMLELFRMLP
ncbi:Pro-kumamolisin [Seiridium cupressi]